MSALLAFVLVVPMFVFPASAHARNLDSIWPRYVDDVVYGGIWSRDAVASHSYIFDDFGMSKNFAYYSDIVTMYSNDTRRWAGRNPLPYGNPPQIHGFWFNRITDSLIYDTDTFTAYAYGSSFIARICGNFSQTFTNPAPPRLSGYKWNDLDGDGVWDSGEPAMSDWKINFYRYGSYMGSATTNGSGYYQFIVDADSGRLPGSWSMTEDIKPGWYQTKAPSAVNVIEGSYSAGRNYGNNNFGNFRSGSLSGAKWNDVNANGLKDTGELGLTGWTIRLFKNGNWVATATTGAYGEYQFNNLGPGSYVLEEEPQAGWRQTAPAAPGTHSRTITSGAQFEGLNFGNVQDGSIQPIKVLDLNMNRSWETSAEPLVAGWTMHLGQDLRPPLVTTDWFDSPKWEQLPAGTYQVWEELRQGYMPTDGEPTKTVDLAPGEHKTVWFYNIPLGQVDAAKYHDLNGNGSRESAEPPITGWEISLYRNDQLVSSERTDQDGKVSFRDLTPGAYEVTEEARPPHWKSTTSESRGLVLGAGEHSSVAFGNRLLGDIEGFKYEDVNGNGIHEADEPPVPDVEVSLSDGDGDAVGVPTLTDGNGRYLFVGVVPGEYVVSETVPDGWIESSDTSGVVTVVGGQTSDGPDFLNVEGITISGSKYDDANADGLRSAAETGLAGWTITLERRVGESWVGTSTVTQSDGTYSFAMCWPGEYRVREGMQPHWKQITSPAGPGVLESGARSTGNDFGNIQLSSLTLYKWDDSNSNGVWEDSERAIPGWQFDVEGVGVDGSGYSARNVTTGDDGAVVLEDLMPGDYNAAEQRIGRVLAADGSVVEPGWRATTSDATAVTLGEGGAERASFGNIRLGWIWGRVTHEVYGNGIGGMKIDLEETGQTTHTNPDGYYYFYDVEPNETSACPTPDCLIGLDLAGTGWATHDAVDKSVVVPEGGAGRADFTVYENTTWNAPRTIGYWKNWKNHYTTEQMQAIVDKVRLGSDEFANLTVNDVYTVVQVDKTTSMRAKARSQYLAFWLNVASNNLGLSTTVNVSSVSGWQQVVTSATSTGVATVVNLIHDAEEAFKNAWAPAVWETIKNIFDKLNNGQLT